MEVVMLVEEGRRKKKQSSPREGQQRCIQLLASEVLSIETEARVIVAGGSNSLIGP